MVTFVSISRDGTATRVESVSVEPGRRSDGVQKLKMRYGYSSLGNFINGFMTCAGPNARIYNSVYESKSSNMCDVDVILHDYHSCDSIESTPSLLAVSDVTAITKCLSLNSIKTTMINEGWVEDTKCVPTVTPGTHFTLNESRIFLKKPTRVKGYDTKSIVLAVFALARSYDMTMTDVIEFLVHRSGV